MLYDLKSYHYDLPQELIAQKPATPRDHSRLMIVDRKTGNLSEVPFYEMTNLLGPKDHLIFNNTKVIPARLFGKKESGGAVELLLMEAIEENVWLSLAKPARKLRLGTQIIFSDEFKAQVIEERDEGLRVLKFECEGSFYEALDRYGQMPLPHYIQRETPSFDDIKKYQTVYAKKEGAVAAPTAGLHFTEELIEKLINQGVKKSEVTLHVGLGTFRPVTVDDIRNHVMHEERYFIDDNFELNDKYRNVCVGTTSLRTLESAVLGDGNIKTGSGRTDIFIYPGHKFKAADSLLTNFHLPGSTLLMLISAFAGYELTMEAYKKAVKDKFRFYSYGDAMIIL